MKITLRLIVQAAIAVAAIGRMLQTAQASNMPKVEQRKAAVLPFKGKERRKP